MTSASKLHAHSPLLVRDGAVLRPTLLYQYLLQRLPRVVEIPGEVRGMPAGKASYVYCSNWDVTRRRAEIYVCRMCDGQVDCNSRLLILGSAM